MNSKTSMALRPNIVFEWFKLAIGDVQKLHLDVSSESLGTTAVTILNHHDTTFARWISVIINELYAEAIEHTTTRF